MPVLLEELVADTVDGPGQEVGEVLSISDLASTRGDPVAQLERRLLREGADEQLMGLSMSGQEQVQGPPHQNLRLPGPWARDDQKRAFRVGHRPRLGGV